MGGVDRSEAQLQSYSMAHLRLRKYYQMFFHLLDIAFFEYKKDMGRMLRLHFLLSITEHLKTQGGATDLWHDLQRGKQCLKKKV
jgi:hypothetical protein